MSCRPRTAAASECLRMLSACLAGLLLAAALHGSPAAARAGYIDGISDQSLPAWDGSFAGSPFASFFRARWSRAASGQISLARYVVQWDVMTEPSKGPRASGN